MDDLFLRKATKEDIMLIYQWANDPVVRQNSFQTKEIEPDEHVKWYEAKMNSESTLFFVLMYADIPVGQIRLEVEGDSANINYSISSGYRGRGFAKEMIRLAEEEVKKNHPEIHKLIAEVKEDNPASQKVFEKEKYKKKFIVYEKDFLNE